MCEEALRRARTAAAMARAAPWDEVEGGAKNVGGRCLGGEGDEGGDGEGGGGEGGGERTSPPSVAPPPPCSLHCAFGSCKASKNMVVRTAVIFLWYNAAPPR